MTSGIPTPVPSFGPVAVTAGLAFGLVCSRALRSAAKAQLGLSPLLASLLRLRFACIAASRAERRAD